MIDENQLTEEDIVKDPIVGLLVLKCKNKDTCFIYLTPISVNWESLTSYDNDEEFDDGDEIIAVLPAPPESYKVSGDVFQDGNLDLLGYEFKNAYVPDWLGVLKNRYRLNKHMDEKKL